ncbi:TonB-dependent receptor [Brevundimonas sp.]|uniref:TonB-dependent receptor n=1 Tax=Brevundimonas sp. TaxID=1871086 RepID=UPI003D0C4DD4
MRHLLACGVSFISLAAGHAFAQSAAPAVPDQETAQVEDIMVTAQKRSQSLQEVPISISAFSSEVLEERGISEVSALSNAAPNVSLDAGAPFSGSSASLAAFIRGIGRNDFAINLDPGVGVYVDGVYLARTVGANVTLPDVERVEILKGPQGTLFGRNTIGGAISVVTRTPGDVFAVTSQTTTGSFNRLDFQASVDAPITDNLTSLITLSLKNRDGYVERVPFPSATPYVTDPTNAFNQIDYDSADLEGGEDEWTLRGKLLWRPSDKLSVTLSGDYQHIDQSALPNAVLGVVSRAGNFGGTTNIPGTALDPTGRTGFNFVGLYNFCIGATPDQISARNAQNICGQRGTTLNPLQRQPGVGSVNVDADPTNDRLPFDTRFVTTDPDKSYATGNSFSRITSYGAALTLDYDLNDFASVKSITAYRSLDWATGTDLDNSPLPFLEPSFTQEQTQFSQELQLIGTALDEAVNYAVGLYYFHESGSEGNIATVGHGMFQSDAPADIDTTAYAAFGQADWRINQLLGVTVGARFTREDKELEAGQRDANGLSYKLFNCLNFVTCRSVVGNPDPSDPLRLYPPGVQSRSFDNFSPKLGVQLHASEDVMAYASWSKGYKSGGWTIRLSSPSAIAPQFDEEEATTLEAGIKTSLFDRRLQLNVAAFQTDYTGIQLTFFQGTSPTIRNAGEADIRGIEADITAVLDGGLSFTASAGYLDTEFTSVTPAAQILANPWQAGTFVGAPLPRSPELKVNFSPRYEVALGNGGSLIAVADITYTSQMWNDTERTLALERPAITIVNANVSYRDPTDAWRLTGGVTNLTDERYVANGLANLGAGLIYGTYSRPREWFVSLGIDF